MDTGHTAQWDPGALKGDLKRQPQSQSAAELASLNQMLAQLNDPTLELMKDAQPTPQGAPATPPDKYSGPEGSNGATIPVGDPIFEGVSTPDPAPSGSATPAEQAAPAHFGPPPIRIVLTGRTGTGKDFIAAKTGFSIMRIDQPLVDFARLAFGLHPEAAIRPLLDTVLPWGRGEVSKALPLTPARLLFAMFMKARPGFSGFGSPTFWADIVAGHPGPVVVPGGVTMTELKALTDAGFSHFHVVCSAASYAQRPKFSYADSLSAILDKQVASRITQPGAPKMRVIWSDTSRAPSSAVYTVDEWLKALTTDYSPTTIANE